MTGVRSSQRPQHLPDDIVSSHRVPPQILAVLTDNKLPTTGDLDKVINLYSVNVVHPLQLDLMDEINEHLETDQQIAFDPYLPPDPTGGQP